MIAMRSLPGCAVVSLMVACSLRAETTALPFYEGFEPVGGYWDPHAEWRTCEHPGDAYCPDDAILPPCSNPNTDSRCWGPYKFESWPDAANGGHAFAGQRGGRQPLWDPMWAAMVHNFDSPTGVGVLHAQVQQYDPATVICTCECNCDTEGPKYGYPNGRPNYQVQGWVCLQTEDRSEAYALGVNSYSSWVYLSWYTKTDGWNRTAVPRELGWRKLEILVHPYTGDAGDVEFKVDDVVVGQGHRKATAGIPIPVTRLLLGGDPAMITQNRLTNSFEEMWYDEVQLAFEIDPCNPVRMDADGDEDLDQTDFGVFQLCYTGSGNTGLFNDLNCHCMDGDEDRDVDTDDMQAFEACWSGPGITADEACDDGVSYP